MSDLKDFFYDWMGGNEVLFLGINSLHAGPYDKAMQLISLVSKHENFPYYFAAVAACALLSLLFKMVTHHLGKWQSMSIWLGVLAMMAVGYATTGLVVKEMKDYFSYPRPYIALMSTGDVHKLEATNPEDDFHSFPSGHVAFATFMLIALSPLLSSAATWCGVFFIMLVAWSRIALGVHFPADVIYAALVIAPTMVIERWMLYTFLRKAFRIRC